MSLALGSRPRRAACGVPYLQELLFFGTAALGGAQVVHVSPLAVGAAVEAHESPWKRRSGAQKQPPLVGVERSALRRGAVPPLRKQCQAVGGQEMFHPMSSSSDREDLVDTAEPHSLLFCRGTRHF